MNPSTSLDISLPAHPAVAGRRLHDQPRQSVSPAALADLQLPSECAAFATRIDRHLADCRRAKNSLAVLSIAIGGVGSMDGGQATELENQVIPEFGQRLRGRVRATDQVLWLSGREFGVILLNAGPETALTVRRRLLKDLGGVYRMGPQLVTVSLDVGAASYPMSGQTGTALWAAARDARSSAG